MSKISETLLREFNVYSNNYEEGKEIDCLKMQYLDYAVAIVESYLGYSLYEQNYEEDHISTGTRQIYLYAQPIRNVFSVQINGIEMDPLEYESFGNYIKTTNQMVKFPKDAEVCVSYTAGYGCNRLPSIIKQTILRIATLAQTEANGNIGITSTSYPDNSRTFVQYSNYAKYLQPLQKLRSFEI